jgi:hypothetical protein
VEVSAEPLTLFEPVRRKFDVQLSWFSGNRTSEPSGFVTARPALR